MIEVMTGKTLSTGQELREGDVRYAEWLPPGHNDEEDAKELSTILEGQIAVLHSKR